MDYHGHHFTQKAIRTYFRTYLKDSEGKEKYSKVLMEVGTPNRYRPDLPPKPLQTKAVTLFSSKPSSFEAYNPKREEYASSYDAEAEDPIADLEFRPDDTEEEV